MLDLYHNSAQIPAQGLQKMAVMIIFYLSLLGFFVDSNPTNIVILWINADNKCDDSHILNLSSYSLLF
jgi:hypothetical protein